MTYDKEYSKIWYLKNRHTEQYKKRIQQNDINFRSNNKDRLKLKNKSINRRFSNCKSGAKKRGITFNLTFEQYKLLYENPCYYCSNKLEETTGLDRLDSNEDYSVENCVPSCRFCNMLKNKYLTEDEMLTIAQVLIILRGSR